MFPVRISNRTRGACVVGGAVLAVTASASRPPAAPRTATGFAGKLARRVRGFLQNNSLWVAGVSGLGIALPSADFLAVIALIHASGETQPVQSMALLFFNVVAFSMVGLPLLSYAAMPGRTYEMVSALHLGSIPAANRRRRNRRGPRTDPAHSGNLRRPARVTPVGTAGEGEVADAGIGAEEI